MQYVALKKVVLYPQKTGELQLEPLVLDVTAEVPTNRRDFFGGRLYAQTNFVYLTLILMFRYLRNPREV